MPNCNPCHDNYPVYPFFTGWWGGWGDRPKSSNCPPSPTPPWSRQKQNNLAQVIVQDDTVALTLDPTFLKVPIRTPSTPVACNLPDGSLAGQYKQIFIDGADITGTEQFIISGTFSGGFTQLIFDSISFSALLTWTGTSWALTGGNAKLEPDAV
jgi:hypothetical protein